MLPEAYRWSHSTQVSVLHLRYGAIARVGADGAFAIPGGWGGRDYVGRAASRRQGIRFVESLIQVRGAPWQPSKRLVGAQDLDALFAAVLSTQRRGR